MAVPMLNHCLREKRCRVVSILFGTKNQNERQVMRNHLLKIIAFCAACSVLAAQAQTSGGTSGTGASGSPGSSSSSSATGSSRESSSSSIGGATDNSSSAEKSTEAERSGLSATGRQAHHEFRGTQLIGAAVQSSTGETIGT